MRTSPRSVLIALTLALALFAAACGGSGSSATEVASADGAADQSETDESSGSSSSDSNDEPEESPIGDLIGEVFGIPLSDTGAIDEYFADLGRQAEVKIAECMLAEGFEYTVVDYGDLGDVTIADDEDREYAEEYGFGITSNPFEESFEAFDQFEDPNQDYVESLSPGEQEAYQATLFGEDAFSPPADGEPETFIPGGCEGEAFQEVFSFVEVFDEFNDDFDAIEEARLADPRMVDAASGWSECMAGAGFSYSDVQGARTDISRRYQAIVSNPDASEDPEAGRSSGEAVGGDGEDTFFFGPVTLKPEYQEQVDALAEEERAVALASWDCNEDFREVENAVRIEYEQKFVDENGAAIRAALDE